MDTIELQCPNCNEVLEIDAGFAGGVCRCSSCGSLMSVPALEEVEGEAARSDRPDAPPPAPAMEEAEAVAAAAAEEEPVTAVVEDESTGEAEFTTSRGRTIHVAAGGVPTAQPRPRRRARNTVVILGFLVAAAVLVGVCVLAVRTVLYPKVYDRDEVRQQTRDLLGGYDPNVNPFALDRANLLGMPVTASSALIVDVGADSRYWVTLVRAALLNNVARKLGSTKVQVLLNGEDGLKAIPASGPAAWAGAEREALAAGLEGLYPVGAAPLAPAVKKAVDDGAKRIVLLTGQSLTAGDVEPIAAALAGSAKLQLDVVCIGQDNPALAELASKHQGSFVNIPLSKLTDWYNAAAPTTP